jgi:hypothetical protein
MVSRVIYNCRGRLTDAAWFFLKQERKKGTSFQVIAKLLKVSKATVIKHASLGKPPSERRRKSRSTPHHVIQRRKLAKKLSAQTAVKLGGRGVSGRAKPTRFVYNVFPSAKAIGCEARRRGVKHTSPATIRRDLAAMGIVSRVMPLGPAHKEGDEQSRVRTCRKYLKLPQVPRNGLTLKVRFSDEKIVDTNYHGCRSQWLPRGQQPRHRPRERYCCTLLVWIVVGVGYKHMVILPRTNITGDIYKKKCIQPIFQELLKFCNEGGLFQEDNAKPHQKERAGLERRGLKFLDWHPRCCDLSPVETVHSIVEQRVWDRPCPPATAEELAIAWREEFDALDQKILTTLRGMHPTERTDSQVSQGPESEERRPKKSREAPLKVTWDILRIT